MALTCAAATLPASAHCPLIGGFLLLRGVQPVRIVSFVLRCFPSNGLPGWLIGKESTCSARVPGDAGVIPGLGSSPGGGHGNPLQYSCLEYPMDRGACRARVHRVAKSRIQLKRFSTHTQTSPVLLTRVTPTPIHSESLLLWPSQTTHEMNLFSFHLSYFICSVQFSRSVVSNSLKPHELQHTRPPCPSPSPGVHSDSCPSSRWCHPAISSSVVPFSSCPQSLPAFPMSQLFAWGGQSTGVSALA